MENRTEYEEVLSSIDEMRTFFKLGEDPLPFLNDLFTFLKTIAPLMLEVNRSLRASTVKLPTATDRIEDVSQATEFATLEILDALDRISLSLTLIPRLEVKEQESRIAKMDEEIANIVSALQVQDISSQKLSHANKILNVIFEKFSLLYAGLAAAKSSSAMGAKVLDALDLTLVAPAIQEGTDDLEEQTRDDIRQHSISQKDIDSLFE